MKTRNILIICAAAFLWSACATSSNNNRDGSFSGFFGGTDSSQATVKGLPDMVSSRQPGDYYNITPSTD